MAAQWVAVSPTSPRIRQSFVHLPRLVANLEPRTVVVDSMPEPKNARGHHDILASQYSSRNRRQQQRIHPKDQTGRLGEGVVITKEAGTAPPSSPKPCCLYLTWEERLSIAQARQAHPRRTARLPNPLAKSSIVLPAVAPNPDPHHPPEEPQCGPRQRACCAFL